MVRSNLKQIVRKQFPLKLSQRIPYNNLPIGITIKELQLAQELAKTPDDKMGALKRANLYPRANNRKMQKVDPEKTFKELTYSRGFQLAFQHALVDRIDRMQVTEDKIIAQLHRVAFLDKGVVVNADNTLKDFKDMPLSARLCISKIDSKKLFRKKKKGGIKVTGIHTKVEFYNGMEALKELRTYLVQKLNPEVLKNNTYINNQYNGDVNNEQNNLNVQNLNQKELDIFLKALGHTPDQNVIDMCEIENRGVVNE